MSGEGSPIERLLRRSSRPDPQLAARLADQVRALRGLGDDVAVTVTELACSEPGCPPRETTIATQVAGERRVWTIHQPLAEIDETSLHKAINSRKEQRHEHS